MGALILSLMIYFKYHRIQINTNDKHPLEESVVLSSAKFIRLTPSIGYSLILMPLKLIYKKVATFLTDFGKKKCIFFFLRKTCFLFFGRKSSSTNSL